MLGQTVQGVGVDTTGVWHDIDRSTRKRFGLPTGLGLSIAAPAPASKSDHDNHPGFEPLDQAFEPAHAGSKFGRCDLVCSWSRSLDKVGEADPVIGQGLRRVAVARDDSSRQRGGPEAIGLGHEANTGVGRSQARVQTTDQHLHTGTDKVGEGSLAHILPATAGEACSLDQMVARDREVTLYFDVDRALGRD